jgi:hypothetical protein
MIDNTSTLWDVDSLEGRKIAPHSLGSSIDLLDDRVVVLTLGSIEVIPDDLPRDPAVLAAKLRALPYHLDDKDTLVVGPR